MSYNHTKYIIIAYIVYTIYTCMYNVLSDIIDWWLITIKLDFDRLFIVIISEYYTHTKYLMQHNNIIYEVSMSKPVYK